VSALMLFGGHFAKLSEVVPVEPQKGCFLSDVVVGFTDGNVYWLISCFV